MLANNYKDRGYIMDKRNNRNNEYLELKMIAILSKKSILIYDVKIKRLARNILLYFFLNLSKLALEKQYIL